ncbi:MAG: DUF302 domain-containing protein [Gammaproteobacteria bacterium]|nr:DUF302 domain-containing protein [Gammaproteobacteria bacterium]
MLRSVLALLLLITTLPLAAQLVTPADSPIRVYKTDLDYEDTKSGIEMAITGQGMLITSTLHISEMLERTAADTGLEQKLYEQAESLEFCSILMSHKMSVAHPANMATCPLTISVYQKAGDSRNTYVAFRKPSMLGDASGVEEALMQLLDDIVREAIE